MKIFFLLTALMGFGKALAQTTPETLIKNLRLESNKAISEKNLEILASSWNDKIQVTVSSGDHLNGKAAYRSAFQQIFKVNPSASYVRTPVTIKISEDGKIASEEGTWTGSFPGRKVLSRSGTYLACWRLEGDQWLISAELYVLLDEKKVK